MRNRYSLNTYRIEYDTAFISLEDMKGRQVAEALVDAEDLAKVFRVGRWCLSRNGTQVYAKHLGTDQKKADYLHRLVMDAPVGIQVDHRNRNGLDCRKSNLRFATKGQNMQNVPIEGRKNATGIKNVAYDKTGKRWYARITVDHKTHQKYFKTKDEAVEAAKAMRLELHLYSPRD